MKKLLSGFIVLGLLVGGAIVYLYSNLDAIAKRTIESVGSDALGTAVRVSSVYVNLATGTAVLNDFSVANPPGFSNQDLLRIDELRVAIDLRSLTSDVIRINSISSVNPYVLIEIQDTRSNIDAVREGLPQQQAPDDSSGQELVIAINEIIINGIQGTLQADSLPAPINVNLGNISIPPVQGAADEVASQIARPLITQLARNASTAVNRVMAEALAAEVLDRAGDAIEEAARNLRDRLGL